MAGTVAPPKRVVTTELAPHGVLQRSVAQNAKKSSALADYFRKESKPGRLVMLLLTQQNCPVTLQLFTTPTI